MNLDVIKNYILKQMEVNPQLEQLCAKVTAAITENERLRKRQQELIREKERAELDLHTTKCQKILNDNNAKENEAQAQLIREMYDEFQKMQTQMKRLDLKELFDCKTQLQKLEIEQKIKAMQAANVQQQQNTDSMENRHSVHKLREQQKELLALQLKLQQVKKSAHESRMAGKQALKVAQCELHAQIIRVIAAVKKLEELESELQSLHAAKPEEDVTKPSHSVQYEKLEVEKPKISQVQKLQGFDSFLLEYKNKISSVASVQELRPILQKPSEVECVQQQQQKTNSAETELKSKRVTFQLQANSYESIDDSEMDVNESVDTSVASTPPHSNDATNAIDGDQHIDESAINQTSEVDSSSDGETQEMLAFNSDSDATVVVEPPPPPPKENTIKKNPEIIKPREELQLPQVCGPPSDVSTPTTSNTCDERALKSTRMEKFESMFSNLMNSPTNISNLADESPTPLNTFDMFNLGSADFPMSDDNSFELIDSEIAQGFKGAGRNNHNTDFL